VFIISLSPSGEKALSWKYNVDPPAEPAAANTTAINPGLTLVPA
jgi:hypothetical protein